jgi:hypothetical protein
MSRESLRAARQKSGEKLPAASVGNRAPPSEPGWPAAVLDARVRRAAANGRQPQRAERSLAADRAREASVCARLVENAHLKPDAVNFSAHLVANAHLKRDSVNLSAHLVRNVRVGPRLSRGIGWHQGQRRRRILDVRAADLKNRGRERSEHQPQRRAVGRRRWRNNAIPFRQLRRRRRQPSEHRSERKQAIKYRAMREQLPSNQCVATPLALSHGCGLIALYTSPYLTPAG